MFKLKLATAIVLATLMGFMSGGSAFAHYALCTVDLDVSPNSLGGAGSVDGDASSDATCEEFKIYNDFDGQSESESDTSSIDFTWDFPEVDEETDVKITAVCEDDDDEVSAPISDSSEVINAAYVPSAASILPAAEQTCQASETITLLPEDDDDGDGDSDAKATGGSLPDTGGPNEILIGVTIALLLVGGGIAYARRKGGEQIV